MSLTKLGNFYNTETTTPHRTTPTCGGWLPDPPGCEIKVKIKHNCNWSYFEEYGYCDYRCGCDLCGKGQALSFRTNILEFKNKDSFLLNDLDIIHDKSDDDIKLQYFYVTDDKEAIKLIYEYYIKFEELSSNPKKYSLKSGLDSGFSITSVFFREPFNIISYDDIDKIQNVKLCSTCYKWFICVHKQFEKGFMMYKSLKYFWSDVINDYICDIIEFVD